MKADAAEAAPRFALDVAALGGMYARSIRLDGTEAGLGVRVDGTAASLERGFTLDANGAGQPTGRVVATTDAAVRASGDVAVSGSPFGGGSVALASGGAITNGGLIGASGGATPSGARLASNGTLAARLGRDGTAGDVTLTASSLNAAAANSRLIAGGMLAATVSGATTIVGGGLIQGRGIALTLCSLARATKTVFGAPAAPVSAVCKKGGQPC